MGQWDGVEVGQPVDHEDLKILEKIFIQMAKERLAYDRATGMVTLFSAKDHGRIVATHNVLEFLALLSLQAPPKGSHLIRYYGWYASRAGL